ncbi:hypothetical protein ACHAQJ_007323 [Trichoderma viride]
MASAVVDMPHRERGRQRDGGDSYRPSRAARSPPPVPVRTEEEKQAAAKAEYEKLLNMRSGGTYIPPARLRALQAQITDKTSKEYQRMAWEALKKSINGLINKVNTANIKHIVPELFGENLVRGRGLFCRSIMKAQAASLPFTPIYAAMTAIVNTKLPQVGELLIKRLIMQFRKGFKRNDKAVCLSSTTFLAHLINQQVQHEMLAGQILLLLLHKPTDDSVEIAVGFCKEVGQYLEEMQPSISLAVFDQFRNILHESDIDKRTQYMIEVLFQIRKDKFKESPAIKEELDLVEEEDQITHKVELDGEVDVQDGLNIFKFDAEWEEHEEAYKRLKAEILGEDSGDEDDDEDDEGESSDEEENEDSKAVEIKDQSNADLVNLRRTIYLTIMSSADPEEAVHKLMKINLPPGQEPELPSMIVECCSQEKTYTKFFGMIGERFAKINRLWCDLFEQAFAKYYETIHRYENNKLRNIAMLFGHMFAADSLGWHCLSVIHLNEEETTSSSRIFIKILFQHILEELGLPKLRARVTDETLRPSLEGIFPSENPRNIRFSINYFTSIGLGVLTEEMREHLQNMPKPALPAPPAQDRSDSESLAAAVVVDEAGRFLEHHQDVVEEIDHSRNHALDLGPALLLLADETERLTLLVHPGEGGAEVPAEVAVTLQAPHGLHRRGIVVVREATHIALTAALHLRQGEREAQNQPVRRSGVVGETARLRAAEDLGRSFDGIVDRRPATIQDLDLALILRRTLLHVVAERLPTAHLPAVVRLRVGEETARQIVRPRENRPVLCR